MRLPSKNSFLRLTHDQSTRISKASSVTRKPALCICKNKGADQLCGYRTADQRLCFRYKINVVQSLYFLNPKFQASNYPLWLYSPIRVGPARKPRRQVFSQAGSTLRQMAQIPRLPDFQTLYIMFLSILTNMSRDVRKPAFCICENKDADQLRGNREADQRLLFSLYG